MPHENRGASGYCCGCICGRPDQFHLTPVYTRVSANGAKARNGGATVLHGIYGYGGEGMHQDKALSWAHDVPVIVEMVDEADKVETLVQGGVGGNFFKRHGDAGTSTCTCMTGARQEGPTGQTGDRPTGAGALHRAGNRKERVYANHHRRIALTHLHRRVRQIPRRAAAYQINRCTRGESWAFAARLVLRWLHGLRSQQRCTPRKVLELSTDLPIVIEIVDERQRIEKLLPYLEETVQEGMMTMEDVRVLMYRHGKELKH